MEAEACCRARPAPKLGLGDPAAAAVAAAVSQARVQARVQLSVSSTNSTKGRAKQ